LVITRFCGFAPLFLFGLAQPSGPAIDLIPLLVTLVGSIWGYFIHANLRWRFGWLEHLISTPAFHHRHHAHEHHSRSHKNFAATMPWIDKLFGTFAIDRDRWPAAYGISEPMEVDLVGQLLQPFVPRPNVKAPQGRTRTTGS
jgi:sterol desaturase/sphingolipid hydroxylase (fatty acid hydroxylase superfamily)